MLERLSGPLCDAVLETTGSARRLEDLVGRTMLVLPLDRHRGWYRYHHLLRDHLLAELRLDLPEEVAGLHARAATWFEANGRPEDAVEHAMTAGDADRVARLVLALMSCGVGQRPRRHRPAVDGPGWRVILRPGTPRRSWHTAR